MTLTPEQLAECPMCGSGDCLESSVLLQATEIAELKEYKQLYENAMGASNTAGWSGVSAAQVIKQQDSEIAKLKAKLAEVMPLAKFGAHIITTYKRGYVSDTEIGEAALACKCIMGIKENNEYAPNIEEAIEQLLED